MDPGLDAFGLQQAASKYYWDVVLPVLERLFDELAGDGQVIRLDRIELDLGTMTESSLRGGGMRDELYTLLHAQLQDLLVKQEQGKAVLFRRETAEAHALRQWWYYMEHGRLQWNQQGITEDWHSEVLEQFAVDYGEVSRLRKEMKKGSVVLRRIVAQHRNPFLETLTGILVAERQAGLAAFIETLLLLTVWMEERIRGAGSPVRYGDGPKGARRRSLLRRSLTRWELAHRGFLSLSEPKRKEAIWEMILRQAATVGPALRAGGGVRMLVQWFVGDDQILLRWLHDERSSLPAAVSQLIPPILPRAERPGKKTSKPPREKSAEGEIPNDERTEPLTMKENSVEEIRFTEGDFDEEGIYVTYAGMILLHPFLSTCFSRLQWWVDGEFKDAECRQKAVFLLHYLATGRKEAEEYELVLPKLLCGYSPETTMPVSVGLAAEEYEEAEELLKMVLMRWEKLQGTSPEGLREGFLQRGGKLFRRNDRLTLMVESHAIDVLLDYLPWNISLVKLPWLDSLLFVEWR